MSKRTKEEIQELAADSRELLASKAFQTAILTLRKQWFGQLMAEQGGGLTEAALCSKLRALEEVATQLQVFINDEKMTR